MMLYLFFSLFVSQPFLVSASVISKEPMMIGEGNKGNKSISGSKVEAEMPTFLLSIYNELGVESKSKFLKIFQAERDQATGEFYFLPSAVRTPSKLVRKADFLLSTPQLEGNELTVSIYAMETGTKVSSQNLSPSKYGWLRLPATEMFRRWNTRADASFRFKVFIKVEDGSEFKIVDDAQVPKVWIVVYTEANDEPLFRSLARDNEKSPSSAGRGRRNIPSPENVKSNMACRKKDMIVITKDLDENFLFPRVFNAYQCSGNCSGTARPFFVRHSIIKTLVSQNETSNAGEPCCIPTKLRSIKVVYRSKRSGIRMSTLTNMIVEECMCY